MIRERRGGGLRAGGRNKKWKSLETGEHWGIGG